MKKLLILLAFTALAAGPVAAQTASAPTALPAPRPAADQQADRLSKQLGLSATQRNQLLKLEQTRRADAQARRNQLPTNVATDRTAQRQDMQVRRTQYDQQLQSILTPEQYGRYTQLRAKRQERQGQHGGRRTKTKG